MGIQNFTIGYYIDKYPGNYKQEEQILYVAAYKTERPSTDPVFGDPKIETKSKPITIPVGDAEIKLSEIKPVNPITTIDDMENLNGYLKTGSDGKGDSKRMIGQCFTSKGQIMSIQFKAEDAWIADVFKPKESKNDSKSTLVLTHAGLKVGESGELISGSFSSLHNMRVNHYRPIGKYLKKG